MTTVKGEKRTETFEDALQRARIRMLCGGSPLEYRRLKKVEQVLNREYCIGPGGNIRVTKKQG